MRKRIIKTVDDAAKAIAELQPEGFTVYFEFTRGFSRDGGHTSELREFHVFGWKTAVSGSHKDYPRITAHTPADIVRKFLSEFLPATRPAPPPKIRGHVNGKQVPRLGFDPMPAFDPTEARS
jgi:hypothetical protein